MNLTKLSFLTLNQKFNDVHAICDGLVVVFYPIILVQKVYRVLKYKVSNFKFSLSQEEVFKDNLYLESAPQAI